ncbi:MAG: glycosyltransferase [Candidatus Kerfeldbacteria bacterium]|nr:glycosyltransferase [Candidatus Kerfeldbacteria bacterium]
MQNLKPEISIVIPAHNEEKYITRTIRSLQEQDFSGAYEIIVVDNASSDATASVAIAAGARVVHAAQKGVCYARQAGTEAAQSRIIVSTDADTTFPTHWLSNIAAAFAQNEHVVAASGSFSFTPPPRWSVWFSKTIFRVVALLFQLRETVAYAPACNFAFTAAAWRAVGGYNTKLTQGGDEYDLLRKLKKEGRVIFLPNHVVTTSSRRLQYGLLYNMIVTLGLYYIVEYLLSRLLGKSFLGGYPAYREEEISRRTAFVRSAMVVVGLFVFWRVCSSSLEFAHAHQLGLRALRIHRG